jgi:prolyl-tRNA synthetase
LKHAITPTRSEDYPEWYLQVIKAADLAEHSCVRGAMVIKPLGYGIWENIQRKLDAEFKKIGIENAYFPLFIPLSFFEKEAAHVEGFAKECAVVTHHRLEKGKDNKLVPASPLEEPLVVRPTSEMIIGDHFAKWIKSYRDLPLKINQWANVVRWEMRTRLFLRTSEILWQEGHTAHASAEEADEMARGILDLYVDFLQNKLALPVIKGYKSELEKFPGAETTYTFEAMLQDRKAIQAGTSHFLGQSFAKSCNIMFQDEKGDKKYAYTTSWGATTRLIGTIIMVHADDDGLILPPKVATYQIVIMPIMHDEAKKNTVLKYCDELKEKLLKCSYDNESLKVIIDRTDIRGGEKNWKWIKKGIPLRIEIGPKDVEKKQLVLMKRTKSPKDKLFLSIDEFIQQVPTYLENFQNEIFEKAKKLQEDNLKFIDSEEEFYQFFTPKNTEKPEIHAGFACVYFFMDSRIEKRIKDDLNVTLRCIPFDFQKDSGECIFTKRKNAQRVIFAKAY